MKQAKTVFFSSYSLRGRMYYFSRQPTLYINGFRNSEQFDSICLDYAYQLVESVVSHGKYEDNMYLFNSSNVVCYIGSKRFFMRTNFIRANKFRLAQKSFSIPGTAGASEELTLLNWTTRWKYFQGWGESYCFNI